MRRLTGNLVAALVATAVASLVVAIFEPFPPLMEELRSGPWTLFIEWFVVCSAVLVLLSWMGLSDMIFIVGKDGIKPERVDRHKGAFEALTKELEEARRDIDVLMRLNRLLNSERALFPIFGDPPDSAHSTEADNA